MSLVSVIIPVRNGERYIAEALDSVMAQKGMELDVIVVDDGSTDATAQIVARYPVRYVRQLPSGVGAALNRGVAFAEGEFLAGLDADDLWTSNKLCAQLEVFARHPECDLVYGIAEPFISVDIHEDIRARLLDPPAPGLALLWGTLLVRRKSFDRVGLFTTHFTLGHVIEWCLRARAAGLVELSVPEVLLRRRLHGSNLGIKSRDARGDYVRIVADALRRRRESVQ